jgi:hypothetical protein
MTSTKYIGMDVHKESISIVVMNSVGKVVMECVIETKASTILQFIQGLRGDLHVTLEEGTWAGVDVQTVGLNAEKKNRRPAGGEDFSLDIPFYRTCPVCAFIGT